MLPSCMPRVSVRGGVRAEAERKEHDQRMKRPVGNKASEERAARTVVTAESWRTAEDLGRGGRGNQYRGGSTGVSSAKPLDTRIFEPPTRAGSERPNAGQSGPFSRWREPARLSSIPFPPRRG
jgi:hypothetical protein